MSRYLFENVLVYLLKTFQTFFIRDFKCFLHFYNILRGFDNIDDFSQPNNLTSLIFSFDFDFINPHLLSKYLIPRFYVVCINRWQNRNIFHKSMSDGTKFIDLFLLLNWLFQDNFRNLNLMRMDLFRWSEGLH